MTTRLLLIAHASTSATRRAAVPLDEGIDDHGAAAAHTLGPALRLAAGVRAGCGPNRRCVETARALGIAAEPDPALDDWDLGAWKGRTLEDVGAEEPAAVRAWLTEPGACPHGGESLTELHARVAGWLAHIAARPGHAVAVTHSAVIRAALGTALGSPAQAFWRIDVPPLAQATLVAGGGRWTYRLPSLGAPEAPSLDAVTGAG